MDDDERRHRLDAHMERGNEIMRETNRIMARNDMTMRRAYELMLRNEIAFRDLRDFLAEQTLALRGLTREIMGATRRADKRTDEVVAQMAQTRDQMRADHEDFAADMRAQRQALFKVLDRLDAKGGEPGVAGA